MPVIPSALVSSLRHARAARAERTRLRAGLDSYRTASERAELSAVLARHSAQDRDTIAAITGRREWAA